MHDRKQKFPRISWSMTLYYLIEESCYLLQYLIQISVCFLSKFLVENLIQSRDWLYKHAFNFWLSLRMLKFKFILSYLRISQCIGSCDEEPCSQRILKMVLFFPTVKLENINMNETTTWLYFFLIFLCKLHHRLYN
jgi:hypothetical protein